MKIISTVVALFFFVSCGHKKGTQYAYPKYCNSLKFTPCYFQSLGTNGDTSYGHYIYVEGFNEECFNLVDFIQTGRNYLDTCKQNMPIDYIIFLNSPKGLESSNADYQDWEMVTQNELVGLYLNKKNSIQKRQKFELTGIEFIVNGNRRVVRLDK